MGIYNIWILCRIFARAKKQGVRNDESGMRSEKPEPGTG